jgi:dihydroorotase
MNADRLTLERLIDLTSTGPARIYGIVGKGRIAVGYDADLTLVDLKARRTIRQSWIASRCAWTPFDGLAVTGWPIATIVRGRVVMRDDQLIGTPIGDMVRFGDTLGSS